MPNRRRVEDFIATVEANRFVEAIEGFYAPEASMQENLAIPRRGRDVLIAHERRVLATAKSARTLPGTWFVMEGDHVVVHWIFEFVDDQGQRTRLEELAHQRWSGEMIVEERFYYDPAQLQPVMDGSGA